MHKLLHLPMHGDDPLSNNHRQQLQFEAGGFLNQGVLAVRHKGCHRTHSLDSPSDRRGTLPSDNLRQKAYYEREVIQDDLPSGLYQLDKHEITVKQIYQTDVF